MTIGLGAGTFLLVVNDDHVFILHGYGDSGLQRFCGHEFDFLGSRDVIGHVIIGLGICGFLLVVHCNHASILHGCRDTGPQRFWGHDLDLLGSRDVFGYVTIKLGMWFPIGGLLEPCVYLAPFRRYKASKLHLPMLKAKSSLRMLRVT